ncbi:MAG: class I SAM-dependent methyltransferase [Bryobacterales bacterium]|nr:class I SAM-dependent methyltransferase [Bryobacterales bacterium]
MPDPAQTFDVKRAEVEFHGIASLGEPERAIRVYAEENERRAGFLRKYADFIGPLSPFLEIGANAGHTSYMLANEFGADGFALDISADALRHGIALMDRWGLSRAPVRMAGDAANLPFQDGSLRLVLTYQTLSQFMDLESIFREVRRVLAPGGVFLLAEEPLLRLLSLRLYRVPYYNLMKPWERKLFDWGLLGYLIKDVVGAYQEESFGIRQNHSMYLSDWKRLTQAYFAECRYDVIAPDRGWGESFVKNLAIRLDPHRSHWRAARLLGGVLAAVCRKEGEPPSQVPGPDCFHRLLRCPDCHGSLDRDRSGTLHCSCGYTAANEEGVYNLLRSDERSELYPGDREDAIDFSLPGHESRLLNGWYQLEGVFGNRYRWIGPRATARLKRLRPGPPRLRLHGSAHPQAFATRQAVRVELAVNGRLAGELTLRRPGIFVLEAGLPEAEEYLVEIAASPVWKAPPDDRVLTVIVSRLRLI